MEWYGCVAIAFVMLLMVVQIERQVILSSSKARLPKIMRIVIAVIMSIIGATTIDQVLFKEDLDKEMILALDQKVRQVLPPKIEGLKKQIENIDSTILAKEQERTQLIADLAKHPTIPTTNVHTETQIIDSVKTEVIRRSLTQIENPKMALLEPLNNELTELQNNKVATNEMLLKVRPQVEEELKSKVGFLDDLDLMISILSRSWIALAFWMLWFFFLLGIELFIVISKLSDDENDYDRLVEQQKQLHMKRIDLLSSQGGLNVSTSAQSR
jgi:hypothetical protein